eukprot:4589205-Amphidinium_carterae.5
MFAVLLLKSGLTSSTHRALQTGCQQNPSFKHHSHTSSDDEHQIASQKQNTNSTRFSSGKCLQ